MMIEHIYPLLIVVVLLVALGTYLMIKIPKAYTFKWIAIPVFLVGAFFSYQIYDRMLGYAYPVPLPETFQFIDYRVIKQEDGEKKIELWVLSKEGRSRLHLMPWNPPAEKQLAEAKKRAQGGMPQIGKKVSKKGKDGKDGKDGKGREGRKGWGSGAWDYDIELYNLPFQEVVPKN